MVRACDFGQKRSTGQHRVKRTFGQNGSCTANLAHVHENWAKTWCAHVILAKNATRGNIVEAGLSGKTGIGTRPCSCTANLAHVHENWAKTWCAHVILAKNAARGNIVQTGLSGKTPHVQLTFL